MRRRRLQQSGDYKQPLKMSQIGIGEYNRAAENVAVGTLELLVNWTRISIACSTVIGGCPLSMLRFLVWFRGCQNLYRTLF